jgi:hypothetical protein
LELRSGLFFWKWCCPIIDIGSNNKTARTNPRMCLTTDYDFESNNKTARTTPPRCLTTDLIRGVVRLLTSRALISCSYYSTNVFNHRSHPQKRHRDNALQGIDLETFQARIYSWASTITSSGQNMPFALPLRTRQIKNGFEVGIPLVVRGGGVALPLQTREIKWLNGCEVGILLVVRGGGGN